MLRNELVSYLNDLLQVAQFQDYAPNGLQIEGNKEIKTIVAGVSCTQALIDEAIKVNADAILVHHGLFWNKANPCLVGVQYQRVAKLIKHNINLLAYHLPLDNHPLLGNNAQLAKLLGINVRAQSGEQDLIWSGELIEPQPLIQLVERYTQLTQHQPLYFANDINQIVSSLAWCSGGGEGWFDEAIRLNVDCYLTGEVNEQVKSLAEESRVGFIAGGHYVSERGGIVALSENLREIGLNVKFVELYNPI